MAAAKGDGRRPPITAGEASLLDAIPTRFADRPWIVVVDDPDMPSTVRQQPVRPSSAAANIQTHPFYTSGLFDADLAAAATPPPVGGRPAAAAAAARRPRTGGPRYWSRGGPGRSVLTGRGRRGRDRRVTLTGAEAIGAASLMTRQSLVQQKLSAELKVKVGGTSPQRAGVLLLLLVLCPVHTDGPT